MGMDAVIFSWSGSFRDAFTERQDDVTAFVTFVHDRFGMEVGLLGDESRDEIEEEADVDALGIDFAVGDVENIKQVMTSLAQKYDAVFFVSDVRAEIVAVNQSGAYTVGYNSGTLTSDELGGVGPNYIVDSLDELQQILLMEDM